MSKAEELQLVGKLKNGLCVYKSIDQTGNTSYFGESISGGCMIYNTAFGSREELEMILNDAYTPRTASDVDTKRKAKEIVDRIKRQTTMSYEVMEDIIEQGLSECRHETVSETISDFIANYTQFSKTKDAGLERVVSVEHIETILLPALRSRLGNPSPVSDERKCLHEYHKSAGIKGMEVCGKCGNYKPEGMRSPIR